jgi:D-arabinose 1-dehydrogenase-like Zn-dependent alcohol dehydrogenase
VHNEVVLCKNEKTFLANRDRVSVFHAVGGDEMIVVATKPFCCSHEDTLKPASASPILCEGVQNLVTDGTVARGRRVIW